MAPFDPPVEIAEKSGSDAPIEMDTDESYAWAQGFNAALAAVARERQQYKTMLRLRTADLEKALALIDVLSSRQ